MGESIREFGRRIKAQARGSLDSQAGADALVIAAMLLVGFGAFGLGRLSVTAEAGQGSGIAMHMAPTTTNPTAIPPGGQFVASAHGHVYYYPWCGGAKSIAAANLVWFDSEAAARDAGYAPAANCTGLAQ
ncbi:MAG TPA: hypothetical protein VFL98_00785 [Candidatus Paceibacterota bacterium]|nr:hypothetical protein [Candidatus Paceibacterota bacterium]